MTVTVIRNLASQMRNAIDALPRESLPLPMAQFPRGACGDASLLLGAFLFDKGHSSFEYICGERGNIEDNSWTSHAWLARGELVVDITADQFHDAPFKVIVEEPSVWHQQFIIEQKSPSDFRSWSGSGTDHLHVMYSCLKQMLFKGGSS